MADSNPLKSVGRPERADFSSTDHTFAFTTRCIFCSAAGSLTVVTSSGVEQAIQVAAGWNPVELTIIRNSGSDALTVDGWK